MRGFLKACVKVGQQADPVFTVHQGGLGIGMRVARGFQMEQRRRKPHLVGDAMMDFPDQEVLLFQQGFLRCGLLPQEAFLPPAPPLDQNQREGQQKAGVQFQRDMYMLRNVGRHESIFPSDPPPLETSPNPVRRKKRIP